MEQERAWIQAALTGDQGAFECLVEAYKGPVYNLAYRMLGDRESALDAAQETFLRAYVHLESYQPDRKFSAWILSIASHHCIDLLRRQHLDLVSLDDMEPEPALSGPVEEPEGAALRSETHDEVQRLLARLPPGYRAPIILRYWHDLSYNEIAQMMGLSESAVKTRLHRARLMLAEGIRVQAKEPRGAEEGRERWPASSENPRMRRETRPWIVNKPAS